MEAIKKLLTILVLTSLIGIGNAAAQCYHPTGFFATESLLNKPGVTYDLSLLTDTGNVTEERGSILYRSHFDPNVAVILTNFTLFQEKGLDIRLQLPTKVVKTTTNFLELVMNQTVKVSDLELMGGRNLNWILDLDYQPDPLGGPPIQVANLTKGNLKVTLMPYHNETYPDTYLRIEVTNMTRLIDQNQTELSQIFDAIGYPVSYETLTEGYSYDNRFRVTEDLDSALDIGDEEFDFTEAMRTELEWLTRNRIIRGLTSDDIETISTLAPFSWGEHNYKSRYYKTGWVLGINEEMLTEEHTFEYQGPPHCGGFQSDFLPSVTLTDFNADFQPFEIFFEQSTIGQALRFGLVGGALIIITLLYFRRRRKSRNL
jgi:hypothetical protein